MLLEKKNLASHLASLPCVETPMAFRELVLQLEDAGEACVSKDKLRFFPETWLPCAKSKPFIFIKLSTLGRWSLAWAIMRWLMGTLSLRSSLCSCWMAGLRKRKNPKRGARRMAKNLLGPTSRTLVRLSNQSSWKLARSSRSDGVAGERCVCYSHHFLF